MNKEEFIKNSSKHSTLLFIIISTITWGIYSAHYIHNQTKNINNELHIDKNISNNFINFIFIVIYLSVFFDILSFIYFDTVYLENIASLFGSVFWISTIIWAVLVRNRMNEILEYTKDDNMYFNLFWSVLFTPFYFNYKVNCIKEKAILKN